MYRGFYSSVVVRVLVAVACFGAGCQPSPGNVTTEGFVTVQLHKSPGTTALADIPFAKNVYAPMNLDVRTAPPTTSNNTALDGLMSIDTISTQTSAALTNFVNSATHRTAAGRIGVYVVGSLRVRKVVWPNNLAWCNNVRGFFVRTHPNNINGHIFIANIDRNITLAHEMWHMLTGESEHASSGLGVEDPDNGDDFIDLDAVKAIYANASGKVTITVP